MRISTNPLDIAFSPFAHAGFVELDGDEVYQCITADEEEGIVICICSPYVKEGDGLKMYTRHGTVKIHFPNESLRQEADAWVADRCGEETH